MTHIQAGRKVDPLLPDASPSETRRVAGIPWRSAARWPTIAALLAAAAAHIPVTAPHLHEAPYIGALFIALTVACLALAAALAISDSTIVWDVTMLVCGLAVLAYVLSRTVGLPQITDDIGNWAEPLGIVSISTETIAVLCGIIGSIRHRTSPTASSGPEMS